jgi:hypothetical protein
MTYYGQPSPHIDAVVALLNAGEHSYKTIAAQLGITKNIVAGIAWRHTVPKPKPKPKVKAPSTEGRGKNHINVPKVNRARKAGAIVYGSGLKVFPAAVDAPAPLICDLPDEQIVGVAIGDLEMHHCRWPLAGGCFCGADKAVGSYCVAHARRAFRPASVA